MAFRPGDAQTPHATRRGWLGLYAFPSLGYLQAGDDQYPAALALCAGERDSPLRRECPDRVEQGALHRLLAADDQPASADDQCQKRLATGQELKPRLSPDPSLTWTSPQLN